MRLIDIVTSPWALQPEKLLEIREIYETHLRGERIDIKAVEARLGQPLVNERTPYAVVDGVAVVSVVGILAKRANLFMEISGGVSTQVVSRDLAMAADDPKVKAILLEIDSPGGQVDGVMMLSEQISAIRTETGKRITAWVNGVAGSGAYWIASAADKIVIADMTTLVGSIGVVATHVDKSGLEQKAGIKTTEITAGRYKRIASSYEPLTEQGREYLQGQVDYLYSVFVEAVAENRGVSVEQVLNDMADGRVFIGQQAIDAGIVDGVSTVGAVIEDLASGAGDALPRNQINTGATAMDFATLKAEHPEVFKAVRQDGYDAGLKDGVEDGTKSERARIIEIDASAVPGHEKLTAEAKENGMTSGEYATRVLAAEKVEREEAEKKLADDAPRPAVGAEPGDDGDETIKRAALEALTPKQRKAKLAAGVAVVD